MSPQSTKTSVGPPDSAMWWSGGPLENSLFKNSILTIILSGTANLLCIARIVQIICFIQEKVHSVCCI